MNLSNLKDTLTTIAAYVFATCTTVIGLPLLLVQAGVTNFTLPVWVNGICGVLMAISIVITQVLTGKTPAGTTKTEAQVEAGNVPQPVPPVEK